MRALAVALADAFRAPRVRLATRSSSLFARILQHRAAEDAASFFSGKTLRIIVGLPPGGSADAYARLVQRHLPQHLPGAPSIVVQNVPGAGGMKSVAYLESLPEDGTAMATFSSGLLTEAITSGRSRQSRFPQRSWIGNVSEDTRICYLWHTTGVRNWPDLLARKQVVFSASAPGTAGFVDAAMLRELFGVHLKQVNGYPGSAEMRLAVEKGEVEGSCGGWTATPDDWLRERQDQRRRTAVADAAARHGQERSLCRRSGEGPNASARFSIFSWRRKNSAGCSWCQAACRPSASPCCAAPSTPRWPIRRFCAMPTKCASR